MLILLYLVWMVVSTSVWIKYILQNRHKVPFYKKYETPLCLGIPVIVNVTLAVLLFNQS